MSIKSSLSFDQAHTILTKIGSITDETAPNSKLSFCETDIVWMTSSSTVRTLWSGLYAVGISGWNCDLTSLPKLAGRITEVFGEGVSTVENLDQAQKQAALVMSAIVGLGFLKTFHYEQYPPKVALVEEAMTMLTQLTERIEARIHELTPTLVVEEPVQPTLQDLYNHLRVRYVDLQKRVRNAHEKKATFKGTEEFSNHIKQPSNALMEQAPAEIQGDGQFNKLRADYIRLIKLYQRLEIEARGYNVPLNLFQ